MLFAHWIIGFGTAGQSFVVSCNCIQLSCCCCIQNQNRLHLPHRNVVCDRQCIGDNKTGGMDHPREVSNAGLGSLHNNMWTLWVHTLCMSIRNKHYLRLLVFWLPPSQLLGRQQHVYIKEIMRICKGRFQFVSVDERQTLLEVISTHLNLSNVWITSGVDPSSPQQHANITWHTFFV